MTETQMFQLFGLTFFAIGVGMFVNPKFVKNIGKELEGSAISMFYGGIMSLAIGYFLVAFYNVWEMDESIILTVMGWIAIFKGLSFLMFPKHIIRMYKGVLRNRSYFAAYFVTGLGVLALYFGFFA